MHEQTDNRVKLEARHGQVWSTSEFREQFRVIGFMAPYVIVRRKADHVVGSLELQHEPRYYWGFQKDQLSR